LITSTSGYGDYPWCIKKDSHQTDGFVAVKFKAISGGIDEAAGLIWRWKDADNYYVARANALEDNISTYYMKDVEHRYRRRCDTTDCSARIRGDVYRTVINLTGFSSDI
jgi:hypothetical protein